MFFRGYFGFLGCIVGFFGCFDRLLVLGCYFGCDFGFWVLPFLGAVGYTGCFRVGLVFWVLGSYLWVCAMGVDVMFRCFLVGFLIGCWIRLSLELDWLLVGGWV